MKHLLASALCLSALLIGGACKSSTPAPAPAPTSNQDTMVHADGTACDSNDQCASGVCEGGCEPGAGVCVAADRACTRDLASYCGCDGVTFQASGSCPGQRFASEGACAP